MSFLTEQEIMALLDTMDPDEIMIAKKDRLDEAGRQLLIDLQKDIQAGQDMFEEFGRQFREADAETGAPSSADGKKALPLIWLGRSLRLPHWAALAVVAVLASIAILPTILDWGDQTRTRGRSLDLEEIQPINKELVEVLIKRGELLLEAGNQQGERDHYEEARNDLMQAYELDPDNVALLSLLARIHEKLGQDKQADRFFEEWKTAKARQDQQ